jgi:quinolinate synthase
MPDKNLGVNTAASLGLGTDYSVIDRYSQDDPGLKRASIVIWKGFCIVHKVFTVEHVDYWRKKDGAFKIIVHPECDPDVVEASDFVGSTSKIKGMIEKAPEGSKWVIGTELNLVNRLKKQNSTKVIEPLHESLCVNMSKNRRRDLLATLLEIESGDYKNQVQLDQEVISNAKKAIDKMLELS